MVNETDAQGRQVIVVAPFGRDGETVVKLLSRKGYDAVAVPEIATLARRLGEQTGVILIAEEALRGPEELLRDALLRQPAWSDVPILVLTHRRSRTRLLQGPKLALETYAGNVTFLERPLSLASLTSAIASAMRFRKKQFEMRTLNETLEKRVQERTDQLMTVEAALRQSQKMESIGQLTGGIAHDFNNMLMGVTAGLEIIRRRLAKGQSEGLERFLEASASSAQRAAALTARLLAFSRRQSLDPHPFDASALVRSFDDLLRRTLPQNIDLKIVCDDTTPTAIADVNQVESVVLNLALNARDAMPEGGQLTVETRSADLDQAYTRTHPDILPGRYAVISVTDTGVGIPKHLVEKVFEPFFTTKPVGQGTGLGLSMVYGFARQSGGQVRIHSTENVGTTVSVYLPAADAPAELSAIPSDEISAAGTGQLVLVVEDDPSVRLFVRECLQEHCYRVLEADRAEKAIQLLEAQSAITLMISDVGLPGMNGRQLAEAARVFRPDLPILFITGYAENAAIRAGFLGTNMAMVTKPFSLETLAGKVSEMMPAVH